MSEVINGEFDAVKMIDGFEDSTREDGFGRG